MKTKMNACIIDNFVGDFLDVDEHFLNLNTTQGILQIKASINIEKPFITGFHKKKEDGSFGWVQFRYECLPNLCFNCGIVGHFSITYPHLANKSDFKTRRRNAFGPWLKGNSPKAKSLVPQLLLENNNPFGRGKPR
ncbi:hypothetical protein MANES_13G088337v8 [Manihot esculenta]|uniref:Uncharacterized protein n=1 Tax=Manihot esculenta TaxID=3983 RepID=A0ACB7GKT2_MANES|nr:hypothetical protein MANES_13G088337v8 [Manihot esculenta]